MEKWSKKEEEISVWFPQKQIQNKGLRVSGLFERFSPEMSAGKWASRIGKRRKSIKVHFQENYC